MICGLACLPRSPSRASRWRSPPAAAASPPTARNASASESSSA